MVVEVHFNRPFQKALSYIVPQKWEERIGIYQRLIVELRDEELVALVISIENRNPSASEKLKSVLRIIDKEPVINAEQFLLAKSIAEYYFCSIGEALFTMIPAGRRELSSEINAELESPLVDGQLPKLLSKQKEIIQNILAHKEKMQTHLIHGITGSGKTRIYIELTIEYLKNGFGVIFLLPEIALSYQFLDQLKPIFGDNLAFQHSGLSRGERFQEYKKILRGEAKLVIGTRSSVFAPVKNLGLIIVDEEHDSSYKEHATPKYNSKKIAHMRLGQVFSKSLAPSLILGSATPSVESYSYAYAKKIHLHEIKERATGWQLPEVKIIPYDSYGGILSLELKDAIKKHLDNNNQVMLLLNRRGHSNYAICSACEDSAGCPHCSVSLSFHKRATSKDDMPFLKCHLCGYKIDYTSKCSSCGGKLKLVGKGTQKVEDAIEKHFPDVEYARLDQDVSYLAGYSKDILSSMREKKIKILIGTQMIAKGFDLPGVTLVGIVNADLGLNLPDFRAAERVYQLITQASGRAGRHQKGEVLIQTMQPHHYSIHFATENNYIQFFNQEMSLRHLSLFPPYCRLFRLGFNSESEENVEKMATMLTQFIESENKQTDLFAEKSINESIEIFGPVAAPLYKIKDKYRYHIIVKSTKPDELSKYAKKLLHNAVSLSRKITSIKIEYDIDPIDLL